MQNCMAAVFQRPNLIWLLTDSHHHHIGVKCHEALTLLGSLTFSYRLALNLSSAKQPRACAREDENLVVVAWFQSVYVQGA